MATHTYSPTMHRKREAEREREPGALHHIRIHPQQTGYLVQHHHGFKSSPVAAGLKVKGEKATPPHEQDDRSYANSAVAHGLGIHSENTAEGDTMLHSSHAFHNLEQVHDHLDQVLEHHEEERGENAEPGEE
jgi:hypothetical protein